jgi:UDP-glucose 4-epimerase
LVTGGAGFIGSHIVDAALAEGHEVAVVDNLSTGDEKNLNSRSRFFKADITDRDGIEKAFSDFQPEYVIHHAAQIDVRRSVSDPAFDARVNIEGSVNILEACRHHGVRKVVYASSAAVYGDPCYLPVDERHPIAPSAPYGISKHTVEHYLSVFHGLYGLPYVALRYSNVYGPRQDPKGEGGVVAIFTDRLLNGEGVRIFGDGEQTRDFVFVGDIARANMMALTSSYCGIINVSSGSEISVNDLFATMVRIRGQQVPCEHAPERPGEIRRSVLANDRAKEAIGWVPTVSLEDGLRQTFGYQASS